MKPLRSLPLLLATGRLRCIIILSTGMATVQATHRAIAVLAFGATTTEGVPTRVQIGERPEASARVYLSSSLVLLQCTPEYLAPLAEANLLAMVAVRDLAGTQVDYPDHTVGTTAAVMSVVLESTMYTRHFSPDCTDPVPDHSASMEPLEFTALVALIRQSEAAGGLGIKKSPACEVGNRLSLRKSLMTVRDLSRGQIIEEDDIKVVRPE